jgi:hypothetical protein
MAGRTRSPADNSDAAVIRHVCRLRGSRSGNAAGGLNPAGLQYVARRRPIGEVEPRGNSSEALNLKEINHRIMRLIIITALTVLSVAGCGDDDEGSEVSAPDQATSAPTGGVTT